MIAYYKEKVIFHYPGGIDEVLIIRTEVNFLFSPKKTKFMS